MINPRDSHELISTLNPCLLLDFIEKIGPSKEDILAPLAIEPSLFDDPNIQIPLDTYKAIIRRGIELTGNPCIGLGFGLEINTSGNGLLGLGAMACDTLIESIEFLQKCTPILNPAVRLTTHSDNKYFYLDIEEIYPWDDTYAFMVEVPISNLNMAIQLLAPKKLSQMRYWFNYDGELYRKHYEEAFKGEVFFNAPFNRIACPIETASLTMPFRNPSAVKQAEDILQGQLKSLNSAHRLILDPIYELVAKEPGRIPTIEEAAEAFHVSSRTLNRRLKSLNTSFSDIVTEVRKRLAIKYLQSSKYSIDDISHMLAYNNSSNFSKAFKNWTGQSPSDFRKNQVKYLLVDD